MDNRDQTTTYCYYCFEPVEAPGICPECGKDAGAPVPPTHLLPGTLLRGRFMVGRALGQDAAGIVYAALDVQTDAFLRVREYFPRGLCERELSGAVTVNPDAQSAFDEGLFRMEASTQTADGSRRRIFFEDNGTGYLVQRKIPEPLPDVSDEAANKLTRNLFILGAIVCVILVGTMVALLNMGRSALDATRNASLPLGGEHWEAPTAVPKDTIRPEEIIPAERPLPTPITTDTPEPTRKGRYSRDDEDEAQSEFDETGEFSDFDSDEYISEDVAPEPTPVRNYKKASPEQIAALQERLMELAWLDYEEPTGKYDPPTRQAILDFQQYVNREYRAGLVADSDCGPQTSEWLNDVDAPSRPLPTLKPTQKPTPTPRPTPTPTPKPTPTPTPSPTPPPLQPDPTDAPAPPPTEPPVTEPPVTEPPVTEAPAEPEQPAEQQAGTEQPEAQAKQAAAADGVPAFDSVDAQAMELLLQLSWLDVPEEDDGLSAKAYAEALKAFQRAANAELHLGLNEEGTLDQATMAALMSADAPINVTPDA